MTTFADKPTLRGERVLLRQMIADDAEHMWSDLHDEEAARLTGTHATFERSQIDEWCATRADQSDRLDLAVIDLVTGDWAGEVVINDWDPDNRSCGLRIALGRNGRNRGLGTEATRLIIDHVFDHLDDPPVNRLSLEVYDFNARGLAVYEKVGFRREGVLREALCWDGTFHDAIVMSIVRADRTPRA
jgi:RimJ/RimL family protein N-acetyltransferase